MKSPYSSILIMVDHFNFMIDDAMAENDRGSKITITNSGSNSGILYPLYFQDSCLLCNSFSPGNN